MAAAYEPWELATFLAFTGSGNSPVNTRDDRLETAAKDIVRHFLGRGFVGKAMVASIDKATALRGVDPGSGAAGCTQSRTAATAGSFDND